MFKFKKKKAGPFESIFTAAEALKDVDDSTILYLLDQLDLMLKNEQERETSLLKQASNMQAAFSFVILAVFSIAPTIITYSGSLPYGTLYLAFSTIAFSLCISLLFATIAQQRKKIIVDFDAEKLLADASAFSAFFNLERGRAIRLLLQYKDSQKIRTKNNNERLMHIKYSMFFFYIGIGLCIFWFCFFSLYFFTDYLSIFSISLF